MKRRPIVNGAFYTASPGRCRQWIDELCASADLVESPGTLLAGIVPHAGWQFSGAVAAAVWKNLAAKASPTPQTVILFGAVHFPGVDINTAFPEGEWATPLGPLEVDHALLERLRREIGPGILREGERAHERDHAIEVQLPFVKALLPECRILPIAAPPGCGGEELGTRIGELTRDAPIIAVGSTDLTHYGERYFFAPAGSGESAHAWMLENDSRMIERMLNMQVERIEEEAASHHNACGPGAITATVAFARSRGAKRGTLLRHTTSHDVYPDGPFEMAVGYSGIVY